MLSKMKYTKLFLVILAVFLVSTLAFSAIPQPTKEFFVNDYADVLSPSQESELLSLFQGSEKDTTTEIVFVSINDLEGMTPIEYATKLGQEWKVGKADKDNGMVLLYAAGVRKFGAATGYGMEGIFPDSKIGRMLDVYYVPQRDSGNVSQGIMDFSVAIVNEAKNNKEELISGQWHKYATWTGLEPELEIIVIIIGIFALVIIINIALGGKLGGSGGGFSGGWSSGGGSFGGGGGFSGGGGSFGGGGGFR